MKRISVLLVVLLLLALTVQVALAHHDFPEPPVDPPTGGSCNMIASWWLDEDGNWTAPGNPNPPNENGVQDGERGMVHVHTKYIPDQAKGDGYTYGATHMDEITTAQCVDVEE